MDGCPGCALPNSRGTIQWQCSVTRTFCNSVGQRELHYPRQIQPLDPPPIPYYRVFKVTDDSVYMSDSLEA